MSISTHQPDIERMTADMPKVDLHCHLEACFRHQTLREIGERTGTLVPTDSETFKREWLVSEPAENLESMIKKFDRARRLWCDPEAIFRLTREAVLDASAQNVKLVEFRYAPEFIRNDHKDLSYDMIHRAILDGIASAKSECDIAIGLIGILMRTSKNCPEVADFIIGNSDSFIGIDIADGELGFPGRDFLPYFERARNAGLHTTAHAGEINSDESRQNVREAIEILKVDRIGHGVHAFSDPELVELIIENDIVLEVCPTSNILTSAFNTIEEHPFVELMRQGVKITINTDDPSLFGIDWNFEYQVAQSQLGLTPEEVHQCTQTALAASFLPASDIPKI